MRRAHRAKRIAHSAWSKGLSTDFGSWTILIVEFGMRKWERRGKGSHLSSAFCPLTFGTEIAVYVSFEYAHTILEG